MSTMSAARQVPETKRKARPPRLREATFEDHAQIAALQSRYGLVAKGYEEWTHLWVGNPLYRELRAGWSIGWVLEDEQRQIVGTMGNIPLLYELDGKRVVVATGCNWAAEPEYRSASLLLLDAVVNQRGVDLYVNNTVSAASAAAVVAMDCKRVPVGQWDTSVFWITHRRSFFAVRLARRHVPFAGLLSYPVSAAVFLRDRLKAKALRDGDVEVTVFPAFDERFDDFWMALKGGNPTLLLAVRTREMLEWHYKHALASGRLWITGVVDGSRLVAYAVFERRDKALWGVKHARLVDFQSLDGSATLLPPLVSWAIARCASEGVHTLEIVGRWLGQGEVLDGVAPYRQELPTWRFFYRATSPALAQTLASSHAWAPSLYDGDASL